MTGTADTEAEEFQKIYNLDVVVVPTNLPMIRIDEADIIYKNKEAKYRAVVELLKTLHAKGQPVLVGTIAIIAINIAVAKTSRYNILPNEYFLTYLLVTKGAIIMAITKDASTILY